MPPPAPLDRALPHPLNESCVVHHSKIGLPMTVVGQTEKSRQRDGAAGLPSTADIFGRCQDGR
jgi:hypothetical protein